MNEIINTLEVSSEEEMEKKEKEMEIENKGESASPRWVATLHIFRRTSPEQRMLQVT